MAEDSLEDILWSMPQEPVWQGWLDNTNREWGYQPGINAENVHLFFNISPFCTPNSANKQVEQLVMQRPELRPRYFRRDLFERELEQYPGEAFLVKDGPKKSSPGMNMLWIVERRWREIDRNTEPPTSTVDVLGYYVIVADRIFAAPTVMDVVQSRWTAAMLQLSTFYKTATSMPLYSIEKGYSYLLPDQKKKPKGNVDSARTSRAGTPVADTASQNSSRQHDTSQIDDDFQIMRSFNLTLQYKDEFMDENPLTGEPGSFKFSTTSRNIKEKEAKQKEADAARENAKSEAESQRASVAPTPTLQTSPPPAPAPIKTNLERKATGLAKGKSPTSALGEGGIKKRRKSKAPGTPMVNSPR